MSKKTLVCHTLIKNEENFIWYALMSVKDYVDKIMVWDTGSADQTVAIVKSINDSKIELVEKGPVDAKGHAKMRQQMLEETDADWIFLLDGDEVWPQRAIQELRWIVDEHGDDFDLAVRPVYMLVGDIWHYLPEEAGRYQIAGRRGHLNIRGINRKIVGLHVDGQYGNEGYFDQTNKSIQNRDPERFYFAKHAYFHASFLPRSSHDNQTLKRRGRVKYELGKSFNDRSMLPEVFFTKPPSIVPPLPQKRSLGYLVRAGIETPLKMMKRRLWPNHTVGY